MSARPWDRLKLGGLAGTLALSAVALAVQPPGRVKAPARAGDSAPASKAPIARNPPGEAAPPPPIGAKDKPPEGAEQQINLVDFHASADDIKPGALTPIPDDPPPHEGAMISIPYIIEPPDCLRIEVLQALPGRPIQGPRLVRPDGKISLDFYGDVDVVGLTIPQVKGKVILHLRQHLYDSALGLVEYGANEQPVRDPQGNPVAKPPAASDAVYVDVESYNSKSYFVQGDVAMPGRFPITGHETVLDAINYAGGFLPTVDERSLRIARPARAGKPARIYPIDWNAIRQRADAIANYQLFPGDRLIVDKNPVIQASMNLNRLSEPLQIIANDIRAYALALKAVTESSGGTLTTAQRDAFIRQWVEFLRANALKPGGPALDEKAWGEWIDRWHVPGPTSGSAPEVKPTHPK